MHQRFDGDGLAVAGRAMEDDASLPRHAEILVDIFAVEEFMHQVGYGLFHDLLQDNVLPFRLLHLCVQVPTLLP